MNSCKSRPQYKFFLRSFSAHDQLISFSASSFCKLFCLGIVSFVCHLGNANTIELLAAPKSLQGHHSAFRISTKGLITINGNLLEMDMNKYFDLSTNYIYTVSPTLLRSENHPQGSYQIIFGEIFIEVREPIIFSTINGSIELKRGGFIINRSESSVTVSSISKDVVGTATDLSKTYVQQLIPGTTIVLSPPHAKKDFVSSMPVPFEKTSAIKKRLKALKAGEDSRQIVHVMTLLWLEASKWLAATQKVVVTRQLADAEEKERIKTEANERETKERLYFRQLFEKNNNQDLQ